MFKFDNILFPVDFLRAVARGCSFRAFAGAAVQVRGWWVLHAFEAAYRRSMAGMNTVYSDELMTSPRWKSEMLKL